MRDNQELRLDGWIYNTWQEQVATISDTENNNEYRNFIAEFKNDPEIAMNDTKWNLYLDTNSHLETKTCEPHHYFQNKTFDKHFRRLRLMDALKQNGIKMEIINLDKDIDSNCDNTLYFIPFKDYPLQM